METAKGMKPTDSNITNDPSTKSERILMKDEMAELRQMVRSFISGQPLPGFSYSLNVQEHGSETRDR